MKFEQAAQAFGEYQFDWGYLISFRHIDQIIAGEGYSYKRVPQPDSEYPFFVIPWRMGEDDPWIAVFPTGEDKVPYEWKEFVDANGKFSPPIPKVRETNNWIYVDWPKTPKGKRRHFQALPFTPRIWDNEDDWATAIHEGGEWHVARTMKEVKAIAKKLGRKNICH